MSEESAQSTMSPQSRTQVRSTPLYFSFTIAAYLLVALSLALFILNEQSSASAPVASEHWDCSYLMAAPHDLAVDPDGCMLLANVTRLIGDIQGKKEQLGAFIQSTLLPTLERILYKADQDQVLFPMIAEATHNRVRNFIADLDDVLSEVTKTASAIRAVYGLIPREPYCIMRLQYFWSPNADQDHTEAIRLRQLSRHLRLLGAEAERAEGEHTRWGRFLSKLRALTEAIEQGDSLEQTQRLTAQLFTLLHVNIDIYGKSPQLGRNDV